jgi:hypothetical protein
VIKLNEKNDQLSLKFNENTEKIKFLEFHSNQRANQIMKLESELENVSNIFYDNF